MVGGYVKETSRDCNHRLVRGGHIYSLKNAFNHIFERVGAKPVVIEGDSFHKYDREQMARAMEKKKIK